MNSEASGRLTRQRLLALGAAILFVAALVVARDGASRGPRYDGKPLAFWLHALNSPDHLERNRAETALLGLNPASVPDLIRALRARDTRLAAWLDAALNRCFARTNPRIPKARLHEHAARLLARLGQDAVDATPDLIEQLTEPDPDAARAARNALRAIGAPAVPALTRTLRDPRPALRIATIELLGEATPFGSDRAASEFLLGMLGDPDPEVRAAAATAVGRHGAGETRTIPALVTALDDPSPVVRPAAARALGALGPAAAPAGVALRARLTDPSRLTQVEAARALWRIEREANQAVPALVAALEAPEAHWQAALALGEIGPAAASAIPALLAKLDREMAHRPARTPPSAALALAKLGPEAVPGLVLRLQHPDPNVRVAAAIALAGHGADAAPAVAGLISLLGEPDNEVRITAANTLGSIGPAAQTARPVLNRLREDDDEYVRAAAVTALRLVEGRGETAEMPGSRLR